MSELPDFTRMTKEEIGDWFLHADTSALQHSHSTDSTDLARGTAVRFELASQAILSNTGVRQALPHRP